MVSLLLPVVHESQTGPGATPRSQTKSESMKRGGSGVWLRAGGCMQSRLTDKMNNLEWRIMLPRSRGSVMIILIHHENQVKLK